MTICGKCKGIEIQTDRFYLYHDIFQCLDCSYWTYFSIEECCRNPYKIVVIDRKDHRLYFIREQCLHCGGVINKNKPLSSRRYGDEIRGELNEYREKEWRDAKQVENQLLGKLKQDYRFYESPQYKYYEYLNSDEWKKKRQLILERDKNICQLCKVEAASEVHHLKYDNIYNEPLEDLESVCFSCHRKVHQVPA